MKLKIRVEHDQDVDNPSEEGDGQWTLYSFNRNHSSFKHPEELGLGALNEQGNPTVKNPGLRRKLDVGLAFVLSYFEHGGCIWSLKGAGPQCRWDTVQVAGLLVWENKPSDMGPKDFEGRRKDAAEFLKTYTAWCNGECYCYMVEDESGETVDSCGGFIGPDLDYMFEAMDIPDGAELEFAAGDCGSAEDLKAAYEKALKKVAR